MLKNVWNILTISISLSQFQDVKKEKSNTTRYPAHARNTTQLQ